MQNFDLLVLGGGPAGYLAAQRAAENGLSVGVVEKRSFGGVCLNEGCIPSKALLHSAKLYDYAKNGAKYGVSASEVTLDHTTVVRRKAKVVKKLVAGVKAGLKASGAVMIEGEAKITGKDGESYTIQAGDETYGAKKLLIATGSVASVPPIPGLAEGLESGFVLTSREILDLKELPQSLVVIGGGVIGLEMAAYFATVGVPVTVVEMLDKIGGPTENEISAQLQKELAGRGVTFCLNAKVTAVGQDNITFETAEGTETIQADKILLSIGRRPAGDTLGGESIGLTVEKGAIPTDNTMQTNLPGVYAAGDVNGHSMLAHTAYREAEVAINNILGKSDTMRYNAIPSVIYTTPEVAGVGETPESATEKGIDFTVAKLPLAYAGRYVAEVERGEGFCKLLLDSQNCLIGAHIIGSYASEIIYGAAMMIDTKMPMETMKQQIFPHPTVSEIIRETLFTF